MTVDPLSILNKTAVLKTLAGDAAEAGVFVIDLFGCITYCSELAAELLCVKAEQVIGNSIITVLDLHDAGGNQLDVQQLPITKALAGINQTTPYFCCSKIGEKYEPWVLRTYPVLENDTKLIGVVVKIRKAQRDVTLESMKYTLVSFAAHQLKTPSSVVKGYLELLLRPKTNAQHMKHYARQAYQANEQLIARSRNLLNLARIEGGLVEPDIREIDINQLVENRISAYKQWFSSSNISLQFSNSLPVPTKILSDATIVQEIIDVLLHNALKHSPVGGDLQITIEALNEDIVVSITDNGPGLMEENKPVPQKHKIANAEILQNNSSHGLGLRMAYQFADLINATINVDNREDKTGVTATITIN